MSKTQTYDFLITEPLENEALRDAINRLYHGQTRQPGI